MARSAFAKKHLHERCQRASSSKCCSILHLNITCLAAHGSTGMSQILLMSLFLSELSWAHTIGELAHWKRSWIWLLVRAFFSWNIFYLDITAFHIVTIPLSRQMRRWMPLNRMKLARVFRAKKINLNRINITSLHSICTGYTHFHLASSTN